MFIKALVAFLTSSVKFIIGASMSLGSFSDPITGFLICSSGAITGVFIFTYGGLWIEERITRKYFSKKKHFTKTTRRLVRLKRSGGLPLVAILTPVILSIPVGCILATAFVHNRHKIVLYQSISVLIWALAIFGSQWLFNVDIPAMISSWK